MYNVQVSSTIVQYIHVQCTSLFNDSTVYTCTMYKSLQLSYNPFDSFIQEGIDVYVVIYY
jgi:hypothetical protein